MRLWLISGMIAGVVCGCATGPPEGARIEVPEEYAFHRVESDNMSVHWNILQGDAEVVAEGYVEHVGDPGIMIRFVNLTLQGLDVDGRVISKATDVPHRDIFSNVGDQGLFRIAMPVTGRESSFVVRVRYWWEPFDGRRKRRRRRRGGV